MRNTLKIVLALLFFSCLLDFDYNYFQFVRFLALFGFTLLAYQAYQLGKHAKMFIYGALALFFQPFLKVALGRELWNIVDIIVGIGLLASLFLKTDPLENKRIEQQNSQNRIDRE